MTEHDHSPPSAHTQGEDPSGSLGGALIWGLLPLIPSIIIVAYFLIDTKIHL